MGGFVCTPLKPFCCPVRSRFTRYIHSPTRAVGQSEQGSRHEEFDSVVMITKRQEHGAKRIDSAGPTETDDLGCGAQEWALPRQVNCIDRKSIRPTRVWRARTVGAGTLFLTGRRGGRAGMCHKTWLYSYVLRLTVELRLFHCHLP